MKTVVTIHGGDYDCSEGVRMCYRAAGVLPYGSYMWTGNEVSLLTSYGFVKRSLSSPKEGDVLWREGHTELYLGNGLQGGARHGDAPGGLTGKKGDQSSTEITSSAYNPGEWTLLLRYEGDHTCDGIPAAIVASKVMKHIIDHDASHGYSQPNRSGDGTIEEITINWNAPEPVKIIPSSFKFVTASDTNIRTEANLESSSVIGSLKAGKSVKCDGWCIVNNRIWAHYIHKNADRFLSMGKPNDWVTIK